MNFTLNSDPNPYILDYCILTNGAKIPALTRKNADFITAIIKLDSNYGKDADVNNKPHKTFDPLKSSKGKECGSTAFWFDKMKNGGDFETCLAGAIVAIDRVNSTHLEASVEGRTIIRKQILKICSKYSDIVAELEKNLVDQNHIIAEIAAPIGAKRGNTSNRYNVSFASKFCAYAAKYLETQQQYVIYDQVIASHLRLYVEAYLSRKSGKKNFDFYSYREKCIKMGQSVDMLGFYRKYSDAIETIIDIVKSQGISKEEFDHIVWYCFKGKHDNDVKLYRKL